MFQQNKKLFLTGIILSVVILAGGIIGWVIFSQNKSKNEKLSAEPAAVFEKQNPLIEIIAQPSDSDGDGLTDEEENKFKTNPYKADSDSDGLFDREEINVYQTDPLNPDTDGDGVKDGDEVKKGDNPKGDGKLLDLKVEIEKLSK